MGKYFEIEKDGKTYKLSFTRRTVASMENDGFDLQKTEARPVNTFETLIRGALRANHPTLKGPEINEVIDFIHEKYGITTAMPALVEIYQEVFQQGEKKKIVVKG